MVISKLSPPAPEMCTAALYERALLKLGEEEWQEFQSIQLKKTIKQEDGPVVTGDPVIDELERKFWEEQQERGRSNGK